MIGYDPKEYAQYHLASVKILQEKNAEIERLTAEKESLEASWERYFGFTFDENGFVELYAMVMGYDERKEIGDPVFTLAQFEEREAENERLTAELAKYNEAMTDSAEQVAAERKAGDSDALWRRVVTLRAIVGVMKDREDEAFKQELKLKADVRSLTAELAACRQAAFENGRETERAAGYGELEY